MILVMLDRLLKSARIEPECGIEWNNGEPVSLQMIREAVNNGAKEASEAFGDQWKYLVKEDRNNDYHIARITYFINHPEDINGIEVDNGIWRDRYSHWIFPNAKILDGHHRLMAAAYLKLKKVEIKYCGRIDVLDYLTGKTDVEPTDII